MKVKVCFMLIGVFTYMQPVYSQVTGTLSTFEGREGYTLKNSQMRITILTGGAYIAELGLLSPEAQQSINPLFIPHYRTIDPHTYTPEKHQQFYGIGRNAKLMAGYMGHYLCFPYFGGGLTEDEEKQGYSTHGEAYTVQYEIQEKTQKDGASVTVSATLPMSNYAVSRTLSLMSGQSVVLVDETMENLEDFERPYHYVQHVNFWEAFY